MATRKNVEQPTAPAEPGLTREVMSDGIQTFTVNTLNDHATLTECETFFEGVSKVLPGPRMAAMEKNLAALPDDGNEAIALHVAEIRRIYAEIKRDAAGRVLTLHELDKLAIADGRWTEIMVLRDVMPAAVKGTKYGREQSARASQYRKLSGSDRQRIARLYDERVKNGEQYGAIKALAIRFNVSRPTISGIVNAREK